MRRRVCGLSLTATLVGALAVTGSAAASEVVFTHKMNGNKVVPGPGDPNGRGGADIVLKQQQRKICFTLTFNNIGNATDAQIRKGEPGQAGPRKVTLLDTSGVNSPQTGCVEQSARQIRRIRKHPREFHVQIDSASRPNGAIRGQLRRN